MKQPGQSFRAGPIHTNPSILPALSLVERWILPACAVSLLAAGCEPTLDTEIIAADIYDELAQTSLPLDAVDCPKNVPLAPGESFYCWGELPNGPFSINVVQDDQGAVSWDVPTSRQVLNLSSLETYFRDAIREETGEISDVDCGGEYRVNRPGDRFDCRLRDAIFIEADERQLAAIQVQVDSQGNVNWQQMRSLIDEDSADGETANAGQDEAA
ncbi:MAG: hypothetical protein ACFB5Z_08195 [Elainellaceae cyanobacterium]